jgi:hypothetical protein
MHSCVHIVNVAGSIAKAGRATMNTFETNSTDRCCNIAIGKDVRYAPS